MNVYAEYRRHLQHDYEINYNTVSISDIILGRKLLGSTTKSSESVPKKFMSCKEVRGGELGH